MTPNLAEIFPQEDRLATDWMARHGPGLVRIALGVVFLWFGVLKFFPGVSPAEELATRTVTAITFGLVPPRLSLPVLAAWESAIGLGLLTRKALRITLLLLALQMAGTFLPLVLFPEVTWVHFPYAPTIEGEFIIKNLILLGAALVVGGTVRGGAMVADPRARAAAEQVAPRHGD